MLQIGGPVTAIDLTASICHILNFLIDFRWSMFFNVNASSVKVEAVVNVFVIL